VNRKTKRAVGAKVKQRIRGKKRANARKRKRAEQDAKVATKYLKAVVQYLWEHPEVLPPAGDVTT
jgi:hypothetical protein